MSNLKHYRAKTGQEILLDLREERLHWDIDRMCEEIGTQVSYYQPMETGEKPLTDGMIARIVNVSKLSWHDRMELYDMLMEKAGKVTDDRQMLADMKAYIKHLPAQLHDKGLLERIDNMLYAALERV